MKLNASHQRIILGVITLVLAANPQFSTARAQGTAFTYQGRLNDGVNPATGVYDLQFRLFNAATTGTQQGSTLTASAIAVSEGLFTVHLDFGHQFPGGDRWLEIGVRTNGGGVFSTLNPRQAIHSTPYAVRAIEAATSATANSVAAGNISGTIGLTQLPSSLITNGAAGVNLSGTFSGDGANVTDVNLALINTHGAIQFGTNIPSAFGAGLTIFVGVRPAQVAAGDFSGDGHMDLAVANAGSGGVSILTNSGSGQLEAQALLNITAPSAVAVADFNQNGKPDVVAVDQFARTVVVWTNSGTGILTSFVSLIANGTGAIEALAVADLNGDGRTDVVVANPDADTLTVLTNTGGGLANSAVLSVGDLPQDVTAADVNGDGKLDLVSANKLAGTLSLLTNDGAGGFTLMQTVAVGDSPNSIAAGDLNGDGNVELVSADINSAHLSVLTNGGTGPFGLAFTLPLGPNATPQVVRISDINLDGSMDLITANFGSSLGFPIHSMWCFTNLGNGTFSQPLERFSGRSSRFAVADFTGDSIPDLALPIAGAGTFDLGTVEVLPGLFSLEAGFFGNGGGLASLNPTNLSAGTALINISGNAATASVATNLAGVLPVANGGTGADDAPTALANLGGASLTGSNSFSGVNALTNVNNVFAGSFSGNGGGLSNVTATSALTAGSATSFTGGLGGDVTGTQGATVVATVGGVSSANVASGANAANAATAANVANAIVTRDASGNFSANTVTAAGFSGSGANVTSLDAGNVSSGVLPIARGGTGAGTANAGLANLGGASLTASNTFSGVNALTNAANTFAGSFAGSGSGLSGLSAGNISSGTLTDARLSANVSLLGQSIESAEITDGTLVNADIHASAAIADTKLATISTSGKVANSATTASSANSANAIVARDASGNFSADTITAAGFTGSGANLTSLNAANVSTGTLAVTRGGTGAGTAAAALTNLGGASLTASNTFSGVNHLTNSANTFVGTFTGSGTGLSGMSAGNISSGTLADARLSANVSLLGQSIESAEITDGTLVNADINASASIADTKLATISTSGKVANSATTATSANTANTIVMRDASGNFSAGAITAGLLTGNGSGLINVPGTSPWQTVASAAPTVAANQAYLLTNDTFSTVTLPTSATAGDLVTVSGVGSNGWQVVAGSGQTILGLESAGATWVPRETAQNWSALASSADGIKLVAAVAGGQIYTSTDAGVTWTARLGSQNWSGVASSADGVKLVAVADGGQLLTSTNSGLTWTVRDASRDWTSVASSADGTKLVAAVDDGRIYTSTNSGVNWTPRESERSWSCVASSADGTKLVAAVGDLFVFGQIYTSTNSGVSWTPRESSRTWGAVASSADGSKLVAAVGGIVSSGQIYTSTDSGVTWTPRESNRTWRGLASSSDGSRLVAVANNSQIFISTDSGATWTPQESSRNWSAVASSSDGNRLVAAVNGGQIYTSTGGENFLQGIAGSSSRLQYLGGGVWRPLSELQIGAGAVGNTQISALDASKITTGTLDDARLSANISRLGQSIESAEITDGTIGNIDVSASAGIAYSKLNLANSIVNADINAAAAIADSKLATITTSGKVANSATTATSANIANAIVSRDASGNFFAGAITASGNVDSGSQFLGNASDTATAPSFSWTGDPNTGMFRPAVDNLALSTAGSERMRVTSGGDIGIGTAGFSIDARLHVQSDNARAAKFDRYSSDGELVAWARDDSIVGNVTVAAGVVSYNAFTGSHYGWINDEPEPGTLMVLTGNNRWLQPNRSGEIIYGVTPCTVANSAACLGSYVSTTTAGDANAPTEVRLVAAVGNGEMWVVDTGTDIRPGDLLISSDVTGCAMLDDASRFAVSHVVARAAETVVWRDVETQAGVRKVKISVLFGPFTLEHSQRPNFATRDALKQPDGDRVQRDAELVELKRKNEALERRLTSLEAMISPPKMAGSFRER